MSNRITATRYHDFSCGHRVVGHESKCAFLHGHNYRVHFECAAADTGKPLDDIGRVIDFSAIKAKLCVWLEERWDHKFLAWENDPVIREIQALVERTSMQEPRSKHAVNGLTDSLVWVPFNPTAENMADYLLLVIGPALLPPGILLIRVEVEETRKCRATAALP